MSRTGYSLCMSDCLRRASDLCKSFINNSAELESSIDMILNKLYEHYINGNDVVIISKDTAVIIASILCARYGGVPYDITTKGHMYIDKMCEEVCRK